MDFLDRLIDDTQVILDRWFFYIIGSYPSDTSTFLKTQEDPFANPVGCTTHNALSGLLDGLFSNIDIKNLESWVDSIVRIRAVQDFKPSEAISFIFALKGIIHQHLFAEKVHYDPDDLLLLNGRIDTIGIMAFDVYMMCKEQIYEIKANEARNQFFGSLSRAGLILET